MTAATLCVCDFSGCERRIDVGGTALEMCNLDTYVLVLSVYKHKTAIG